ncbi:hypothetical protein ANCDUO_08132 [Ancylostoma duodenale]|uniref:SXP/RAL-2 family protein Ani s 5-like cation-binding domain-containing protein n=1 Tax=Ancylostoma duodenale TaxID=51022 RepID=A0A0C2DGL2_9BILA|nr:hypothetical protein ANCDUO_08132 [Ancylostoma duodenale]
MKLRNIWGNYRQGADCSNEHHQTRQILHSLPTEVRSAIFRHGPHPPFGPPPCGLPPFIDKLPADAQMKLRDIWKNYRQGADCSNEHGQTFQLMHSLPQEVRRAIFRPPPPPRRRRASKTFIEQLAAIYENESISLSEKPKKLKELARKMLKGDELKRFNESLNTMKFTKQG